MDTDKTGFLESNHLFKKQKNLCSSVDNFPKIYETIYRIHAPDALGGR